MAKQYPLEFKESMVQKFLLSGLPSSKFASEHSIAHTTFDTWVKRYTYVKEGLELEMEKIKRANDRTNAEKFALILKYESLEGDALGEFLRTEGLTTLHLDQWRKEFISPNKITPEEKAELKQLKVDKKKLEKELLRKEKALAEASTLLMLKKKADLIWGISEDEE